MLGLRIARRIPMRKAPSPKPTQKRLVSLVDAAEYAACTTKTLRRRISDGTITGYRFGPRLIRVDMNELDSMLMSPIPSARTGGDAA